MSAASVHAAAAGSGPPAWLLQRQRHVQLLGELHTHTNTLQGFTTWAAKLKAWLDLYADNGREIAAKADTLSSRVFALQSDLNRALKQCMFIDPITQAEHVIGARVGVVGSEKAGKVRTVA